MGVVEHSCLLRVRYSETDQMGTYYNSRPLEWFECGRSELLRAMELPYSSMEQRGIRLPLVEAHVFYHGKARYDDELRVTTRVSLVGKARMRFDVTVVHAADEQRVVHGHTVHAIIGANGRPVRPPEWLSAKLPAEGAEPEPTGNSWQGSWEQQ
ncbi:MAG TPA: thioesterase family protein [Planctomycetota bacterium]|jgi:acyl-CoA thioester hydrolase